MRSDSGRGDQRRREGLAAALSSRTASVVLLIFVVLATQAGFVYVAVDQIGTATEPGVVVQPRRGLPSSRPPISVDAEDGRRIPAPTLTRAPGTLQAEVEDVGDAEDAEEVGRVDRRPTETGLDRARERRPARGVAPPLTGQDPPRRDPSDQPAEGPSDAPEPPPSPAPEPSEAEPPGSEPPDDRRDPHGHRDRSGESPSENPGGQHGPDGHDPHDHEPPGLSDDHPGAGDQPRGQGEARGAGQGGTQGQGGGQGRSASDG